MSFSLLLDYTTPGKRQYIWIYKLYRFGVIIPTSMELSEEVVLRAKILAFIDILANARHCLINFILSYPILLENI